MSRYREKREALIAIAARQHGYFTAHLALLAGYAYPRQHYHVQTGDWERVARAVFRLRDYPLPERADLNTALRNEPRPYGSDAGGVLPRDRARTA